MTKSEVISRHRGSFLGSFWIFINLTPVLPIYAFDFGIAFKTRSDLSLVLFFTGAGFLALLSFLPVIRHSIQSMGILLPFAPFNMSMDFSWLLTFIGIFVCGIDRFIGLALTLPFKTHEGFASAH